MSLHSGGEGRAWQLMNTYFVRTFYIIWSMNETLIHSAIFVVGELAALIIFWLITKMFSRQLTLSSVLRGALERLFIYIILLVELPQGLAFFGALKIATRLKDDDKISNDYFLVGNLTSVLTVIGYYFTSQYFA